MKRRTRGALAANVRGLRLRRRMTQAELGRSIGADQQEVSRIERGVHGVSVDRLDALAAALGVTPSDLVAPLQDASEGAP